MEDTIYNTGIWKNLFIEAACVIWCPFPFIHSNMITNYYSEYKEHSSVEINTYLLGLMMFLRTYPLFKAFLTYSSYSTSRATRMCGFHGVSADNMFALKSIKNSDTFILLGLVFLYIAVIFGYVLRLLERSLSNLTN
jgi:hypothetical protein